MQNNKPQWKKDRSYWKVGGQLFNIVWGMTMITLETMHLLDLLCLENEKKLRKISEERLTFLW